MTEAAPAAAATVRAAPHGIEGRVDAIHAGAVIGWAFDPADPEARLNLRVLHADRPIGAGIAEAPRRDVQAHRGHPDGAVGFLVELQDADWWAVLRAPQNLAVLARNPRRAGAPEQALPVAEAVTALRARHEAWHGLLDPGWSSRPVELAIACILRDEARYLPEWLAWHLALGAQLIRLYDNGSTDGLAEIVAPYIAAGLVELVAWPELGALAADCRSHQWPEQNLAYMHAIATLRDRAEWLALLDVDEFVMLGPEEAGSLPAFLRSLPLGTDLATLYWRGFGSSGHARRPPGLVVENFRHRAADPPPGGTALSKPVLRPVRAGFVVNAHAPVMRDGTLAVPGGEGPRLGVVAGVGPAARYGRAWINHYHTRSREEFDAKVARGWPSLDRGHKAERADAWFAANDHAAVEDAGALRFVPATRALMACAGRFGAAPQGRVGGSGEGAGTAAAPASLRARVSLARPEPGLLVVQGMAVDLARPDRRLPVVLHDAFGRVLGEAVAAAPDLSLSAAGFGDGRYAFRISLRLGAPSVALSRLHFRIGETFGIWRETWPVAACTDLAAHAEGTVPPLG